MSHTNSTPNYNLPQFAGTDKPTWLNDFNGAMSAIDTQMKANADSATQANTNATTAVNNTGTLANLNTTDKTSLVGAVNEVNINLGVVSGVASGASASAGQANSAIAELSAYLNLTTFGDITFTPTSGSWTSSSTVAPRYARNTAGTVGKVYGDITGTVTSASGITVESNDLGFRPESDITVNGIATKFGSAPDVTDQTALSITFKTNGKIQFSLSSYWYNRNFSINLHACMVFLKNFGDTPENA